LRIAVFVETFIFGSVAARLERSSFCRSAAEEKKREWKAEIAAQKKSIKIDYLNQ